MQPKPKDCAPSCSLSFSLWSVGDSNCFFFLLLLVRQKTRPQFVWWKSITISDNLIRSMVSHGNMIRFFSAARHQMHTQQQFLLLLFCLAGGSGWFAFKGIIMSACTNAHINAINYVRVCTGTRWVNRKTAFFISHGANKMMHVNISC